MQSLTVITSTNRQLTKNHITGESYDSTSKLTAATAHSFDTLKELQKLLNKLRVRYDSCVIRGVQKAGISGSLRRRKTHFEDVPQAWVMLDLDSLKLPKRLRSTPYTDAHALFASRRLPAAFHGCGFVWQASASAGVDPKVGKLHLWFLLDAPLSAAQLRVWSKMPGWEHVDPATLAAVQCHYTADPIGGPYVGPRLGRIKGPRVTTPLELAEVVGESHEIHILPRPEGSADVSDSLIAHVKKERLASAREHLANPETWYKTAYTIGTCLGGIVALKHWNNPQGHEQDVWMPLAAKLSARWGKRVAAHENAGLSEETYVARTLQGIEWGMGQKRERLGKKSQKVIDDLRESTRIMQEKLLKRAVSHTGSETVMREVAAKLGKYREISPDVVHKLSKNSGFSEAQVLGAMEGAQTVQLDAWRAGLHMVKDEVSALDTNIMHIFDHYPGFAESFETNIRTRLPEATEANVLGLKPGVVEPDSVAAALLPWLRSLGMHKHTHHRVESMFRLRMKTLPTYDPFLRLFPEASLPRDAAAAALEGRKPRLHKWLWKHFGVERTPYTEAAAAKTLISAVARAKNPGAQVDTMLVLIGEQGIGKTSALRTLGNVIPFGYTELLDIKEKDSILAMHKSIIAEMSELKALRTSQEEAFKAFVTRTTDRLRAPYARDATDMARRMVFIGTTNDDDFLRDRANRRYWPVVCTGINTLDAEAAQHLWSEAALRYAAGEQWWLNQDESALQVLVAAGHRAESAAELRLGTWVRGLEKDSFSFVGAVTAAFPNVSDTHRYDSLVSGWLKGMGCKRVHTRKKRFWLRG